MGKKKKNKKKLIKAKNINSFIMDNRVLIAALGGAAAGISLAGILGTEKAKEIIDNISGSARKIAESLKDNIEEKNEDFSSIKSKKANHLEKEHA